MHESTSNVPRQVAAVVQVILQIAYLAIRKALIALHAEPVGKACRLNAEVATVAKPLAVCGEAKTGRLGERLSDEVPSAFSRLFDLFPQYVADALIEGRKIEPRISAEASVVYLDVDGFGDICSTLAPEKIADLLHRLYCGFDMLSLKHGVYKVKACGDVYMVVANLVSDQESDHAKRAACFAMEALEFAQQTLIDTDDISRGSIPVRAGFSCGPVVGDVMGLSYCVVGDAVNVAWQIEMASCAGHVLCSELAAKVLREQAPEISTEPFESIAVSCRGETKTFWVFNES